MQSKLEALYPNAVSPNKFAHFVVRATDIAPVRDWYKTVLNGDVAFENEMCSFITYDGEHHRVGIIKMPAATPSDPRASGLDHVAFTYDDLGKLLSTYRRLRGENIHPFWSVIHGPTISIYYTDPTGTRVELQYDVFKTHEEINEFFAGGAYDENCVGVMFDPEAMATKFEDGVPLSELVKRPKLPEGMDPWSQVPAL